MAISIKGPQERGETLMCVRGGGGGVGGLGRWGGGGGVGIPLSIACQHLRRLFIAHQPVVKIIVRVRGAQCLAAALAGVARRRD